MHYEIEPNTRFGEQMLVGLTGLNASGKTTIVEWFSDLGFGASSCSNSIRIWLTEQGLEETRDNLRQGGRTLREQGGAGVLAEMLLAQIGDDENFAIDSIRTPAEVNALRVRQDFILLEVRAERDARWHRLVSRNRIGDAENYEQFVAQEQAELTAADSSGQALTATAEIADLIIDNNGTLDELYHSLEQLIELLAKKNHT
jgi:dephospho-CoA kinase